MLMKMLFRFGVAHRVVEMLKGMDCLMNLGK